MPPRAVKRQSSAAALKKKPPPKTPVVETNEESKEAEIIELSNTTNEEQREPSPPPKEDKELTSVDDHEYDRSERLELEDKDPQSEAEEEGRANIGIEEDPEMEEEYDEEGIDGNEMMEDIMEGEEEEEAEDGGDEHGEEVDGDEEHHDVVKERRKRKEFEVFVGGLDRDATEEDLRKIFSQVGEVTEVRLMKNPLTQKNKGFAFLRFATVEQAKRAVNELKNPVVNGKQFGVAPSQDSDTLFVGNICKTWTKETFKEKLAQYGVDNFEELTLVEDTRNEGMNRGFAFLDFSSRADALDACKHLQKRDVLFGTDRPAKVAFADTFIEEDDEVMAQVRTVFLDGLPAMWDEDRVKDQLNKFGKIEKVELARNMPAAKRTDFGFVTFDTHDGAVACVEAINNTELGDGEKKVKVRARLSRPRQRGKSVKHGQGGYLVERGGGRGSRAHWNPGMPRMDPWRFAGRSARGMPNYTKYSVDFKRSVVPRDRYAAPDRVGSRWGFPSSERSFDQRRPGPNYGKSSSKRDYVRRDETFHRSSDFVTRAPTERPSSFRDTYSSHGSGYLGSSLRNSSRSAAHRPEPLYAEESYDRYMERPSSYRGGHSRDYSSISGSKRSHSATEEIHSRYAESTLRQPRARFDYEATSASLPYNDTAYERDSIRLGRGSHLGYDRSSRSSAGYSHELYDTHTSSMGYNRDEVIRGDGGGFYSSYGRDYMSTGSDVGASSYSSLYSSRRTNDGYSSGRGYLRLLIEQLMSCTLEIYCYWD
ncbi:RNA recognition motif domain [Macleaya cordata]|uniref:RNA recognition motif domain n=1 Tax=Macleaya cordata TaxID=56857 RepID=A0A200PN34_MACCD|nr:RNA recognition motif domain [Macleaya cordata]